MINLLPPDQLRELRAARANTLLLRYNIFLIGILVFIVLSLVVVYFYLATIQSAAEATKRDNDAKVTSYARINSQADAFRKDLASAKDILDQEATYSKTILTIAGQLPSGVVIDTLSLDASTFGTPTVLALKARDQASALAAKEAFQKSPIFSAVHFTNLTTAKSASDGYPVTANLSVVISKDAAK